MVSKKTSTKRRKSSAKLIPHDPTKSLKNRKVVLKVLIECLVENDLETFEDVLVSYLRVTSKTRLSKQSGIGRRTLYDLIEKQPFNPGLKTVGALLNTIRKDERALRQKTG